MQTAAHHKRCNSGEFFKASRALGGIALLMLLIFIWLSEASPAAEPVSLYSPRALELIQQMADSYASLSSLEQKTIFHSSMIPINAEKGAPSTGKSAADTDDSLLPRTMKLAFQSPNQILVEMRENGENDTAGVEKWISDGTNFYSFQQTKNTYTKEKAPGRLRDFSKLNSMTSGSLELLMLMGINPFKDIKNLVQSVQIDDLGSRQSSSTNCILMKMASQYEQTELRLTLDSNSHLLLMLAMERTPITTAAEIKHPLGDALDELDTASTPAPSVQSQSSGDIEQPKFKTLFSYENKINMNPHFNPSTFSFLVPKDALLHEPFDPTGKLQKKRVEEQLANMLKGRGFKKRPRIFK